LGTRNRQYLNDRFEDQMNFEKHLTNARSYHALIGELIAAQPSLLPGNREEAAQMAIELRKISSNFSCVAENKLVARAAMVVEELAEWIEAHIQEDLIEATDALADRLFLLMGDAVASGLPIEPAYEFVSQSNQTKLANKLSDSGKGVKGYEYECPKKKIAKLLGINR